MPYQDLTDDELMRLFIGETKLGIPLEPEGFVAVCRSGPTSSGTLLYELDQLGDDAPVMGDDGDEDWDEGEDGAPDGDEAAGGEAGEDEDDGPLGDGEDDGPEGVDEALEDDGPEGVDEALEAEAARQDMLTAAALGPPGLTEDAEGVHRPRRVWVLMGGDADGGQQATASLRSGLEVVRRLGRFSDLQAGGGDGGEAGERRGGERGGGRGGGRLWIIIIAYRGSHYIMHPWRSDETHWAPSYSVTKRT